MIQLSWSMASELPKRVELQKIPQMHIKCETNFNAYTEQNHQFAQ